MLALTASAWKGHTSLPPTCHWPKQATKIPSEFGREGRIASPQGGRLEQVKPGCWVTRHTVPQWLPVALRIWSKTLARPTRLPVTVSAELSNFTSPFPSLGVCSLATLLFPHSLNMPCTLFWGSVNIQIPLFFVFSVLLSLAWIPLFVSSCLSPVIISEKPSPDSWTGSASFVMYLPRTVFFSFTALIWAFTCQSISVIRWWMSVFPVLTLRSVRTRTISVLGHVLETSCCTMH